MVNIKAVPDDVVKYSISVFTQNVEKLSDCLFSVPSKFQRPQSFTSLFDERQTIPPVEAFAPLRHLSTFSDLCPLHRDRDSLIRIERLLGLHDFQPSFYGFFDIC